MFSGDRVSVLQDEKNSGDGWLVMVAQQSERTECHRTVMVKTLKMVKIVNFIFCVFYHNETVVRKKERVPKQCAPLGLLRILGWALILRTGAVPPRALQVGQELGGGPKLPQLPPLPRPSEAVALPTTQAPPFPTPLLAHPSSGALLIPLLSTCCVR